MNPLLHVNNISKTINRKQILRSISFDIYPGDILALIGPNGAGKTTTIKMILGLQSIDDGQIRICGNDISREFKKAFKCVGSIVEFPDFYPYLTAFQNLSLLKRVYHNISDDDVIRVLDMVGLKNNIREKVGKFSLGMKQRLGLAKALLANPKLLILDEPTNGLDPSGIKDLRNLLKSLTNKGIGILISSHNLSELEHLCNKVCIIKNGLSSRVELLSCLYDQTSKFRFTVDDTDGISADNIKNIEKTTFTLSGTKEDVANMVENLVYLGRKIYLIEIEKQRLEDIFLDRIEGGINE